MFTNKTVIFDVSQLAKTCECDITPNTCDYLCCCDSDCPKNITQTWINTASDICANKSKFIFSFLLESVGIFTECFNKNILIFFNSRRGLFNYTDEKNGVICVSYDNSADVYSFFKILQTLNSTEINNLHKYYAPYASKTNYLYNYFAFNATYLSSVRPAKKVYFGGEILRAVNPGKFVRDQKIFLLDKGAFGECVLSEPLRFNLDSEVKKCGLKIVNISK